MKTLFMALQKKLYSFRIVTKVLKHFKDFDVKCLKELLVII